MQPGNFDPLIQASFILLTGITIAHLYHYRHRKCIRRKIDSLLLDQERNLVAARLEIQEETFQHIAREIHDNISLSLTLAKLQLHSIDPREKELVASKVNYSVELLTESIANLRNISRSLNADLLESQGLIRTLEMEISRIRKAGLFEIDFQLTGEPVFLDTNRELFIFRIIQEAFNNIIKHAKATRSRLELHYCEAFLNISIEDNGIGFRTKGKADPSNLGKAGLRNMYTRTRLIRGTMMIESARLKGTKLFFNIPI